MTRPQRPSTQTILDWQDRRFGLFIHWGLYSILGGVWNGEKIDGYNEQIQAHARIPRAEYGQLTGRFNPVLWDPDSVVDLAKSAGMKFVVITSKHHDGFSLFGTVQSPFNVVDATPYGKDIVAGLAAACAKEGLGFGVYFSTIDWNYDGATGIDYDPVAGVRNDNDITNEHAQFNAAQLTELLTNYGPISEVWFDMGKPNLEQSVLFADTVHRIQPETMVSGRVFNYQGDFTVMGDNEIPEYALVEPWQSPASIFHETWGYRSWQVRDDLQGKIAEHIKNLVKVVSRGGNYLLNIGPRGDGSIVEFEAEVLRGIGRWISENEVAITATLPQPFRHLEFGAATAKGDRLYLFVLDWPDSGILELPGLETEIVSARRLNGEQLVHKSVDGAKRVLVGNCATEDTVPLIEVELAGPAVVNHPAIQPNGDHEFLLSPDSADKYYHRNGFGYSDPPKLHKLRWSVEPALGGNYRMSAAFDSGQSETRVRLVVGDQVRTVIVPQDGVGEVDLGVLQLQTRTWIELATITRIDKDMGSVEPLELSRLNLFFEK